MYKNANLKRRRFLSPRSHDGKNSRTWGAVDGRDAANHGGRRVTCDDVTVALSCLLCRHRTAGDHMRQSPNTWWRHLHYFFFFFKKSDSSCYHSPSLFSAAHLSLSLLSPSHLSLFLFISTSSKTQVRLLLTPPGLAGLEDDSNFSAARLLFLFSASLAPPPPLPPPSLPPFSFSRSFSFSRLLLVRSGIFSDELLPLEKHDPKTDAVIRE